MKSKRDMRARLPFFVLQRFQSAGKSLLKQLRRRPAVIDAEKKTAEPHRPAQSVTFSDIPQGFGTAEMPAALQDVADHLRHMILKTGGTGGIRQYKSRHAGIVSGLLSHAQIKNLVENAGRQQTRKIRVIHRMGTKR